MYNEGISLAGDLLDVGVDLNVVSKSGNSYSYESQKLGVGRETAKAALRERPDLMKEIREKSLNAWQSREESQAGSVTGSGRGSSDEGGENGAGEEPQA